MPRSAWSADFAGIVEFGLPSLVNGRLAVLGQPVFSCGWAAGEVLVLELVAGVLVGISRSEGFGGTVGDAVFVVTLVALCVALLVFGVGSWLSFGRLLQPGRSLAGVLVSDLFPALGAGSGRGALVVAAFGILFLVLSVLGAGLFVLGVAYSVGELNRVVPVLLVGVVAAVAALVVLSVFGVNVVVRAAARAVCVLTFYVGSVFAPWPVVGSLVAAGGVVGLVLVIAVFSDHAGARCLAAVALGGVFGLLFL